MPMGPLQNVITQPLTWLHLPQNVICSSSGIPLVPASFSSAAKVQLPNQETIIQSLMCAFICRAPRRLIRPATHRLCYSCWTTLVKLPGRRFCCQSSIRTAQHAALRWCAANCGHWCMAAHGSWTFPGCPTATVQQRWRPGQLRCRTASHAAALQHCTSLVKTATCWLRPW